MIKQTHCLSWYGGKHKLYRKDLAYLKLLAFYKAFYYNDVKLDNILITRSI